ncbi:unnamed protein product [Lupinus luteus]|uniref:arginine--tRNA ligase n=1 Tax=Lupinus luteus TaxID=3873 RepID=A0AAV1YMM8_LUPLU
MASGEDENGEFYLRYYVGHKGKFGHEFLEFEFRSDGKLRYANNSNYKNDTIIRKEVYLTPAVLRECRRIISQSEIMKEDDNNWPEPDRVGRQELEIVMGNEHISFTTSKIGSLMDVQNSADPEGLRIFYYLVQGEDNVSSVKRRLAQMFEISLRKTAPGEPDLAPIVDSCSEKSGGKFGDYQCNNAMVLWSKIKGKQREFKGLPAIGQAIVKNLPPSEMIESCSVAGPGFVNVVLSKDWIAQILLRMLIDGIDTWAPLLPLKTAVVDFSSPNIAKEMHVGNLRSTIIGDTLARMLEFSHVEVLRRNHVGDWGTQFGMLIEFLFEKFPNTEEADEPDIGDLQAFYKASKLRFNSDPEFKQRAQQAVVWLQGGEDRYHKAWKQICEISRTEFHRVYERLGIKLEEKGESFYNPYIPKVLEELDSKGLIEESEYRLNEEKAEWIIYVTDVGQQQHFDTCFKAAKLVGWLPTDDILYPKATHVGFGLVLGEDGKRFRTRNTDVVRLVDLLDEAKSRSKIAVLERDVAKDWPEEEVEKAAEAIGYGAVKYADLKNNRLSNYTFNFDQMLNDKGNTAVYLLYAHARICSIIRKSGKDIEELRKNGKIVLDHEGERALGLHLVQFSEVIGSPEETSRLLLCEATATVMRKCFYLLGIQPVYKI